MFLGAAPWKWTGIGGEMVVRKTKQAGKVGRKPDPEGLKELSRKADETLKSKGGTIAEKLGSKAEEGNVASAELLVKLADRMVREEEEAGEEKRGPSLAERWAQEPAFKGPKSLPEGAGRASAGSREPEG